VTAAVWPRCGAPSPNPNSLQSVQLLRPHSVHEGPAHRLPLHILSSLLTALAGQGAGVQLAHATLQFRRAQQPQGRCQQASLLWRGRQAAAAASGTGRGLCEPLSHSYSRVALWCWVSGSLGREVPAMQSFYAPAAPTRSTEMQNG
jgi:hypothetical protein